MYLRGLVHILGKNRDLHMINGCLFNFGNHEQTQSALLFPASNIQSEDGSHICRKDRLQDYFS